MMMSGQDFPRGSTIQVNWCDWMLFSVLKEIELKLRLNQEKTDLKETELKLR